MAGSLGLAALRAAAAEGTPAATTVRTLGKTGIQCTVLGMGTGVRGWNGSSELTRKGRETTLAVFERAYGLGLRYFDLADMYGSHAYMREMMRHTVDRDKVMILTKTTSREPAFVRADLERFRKELDTDYVDVVLMHCLTARDGSPWTEKLGPAMDVLSEAKENGVIRAHGVSCHSLTALKEAAESDWVDVMLSRINPFGTKMDGPPEEVAPVLKKAYSSGKGMLGMKIVGEGELRDQIEESMRYVLGLGCIHAMPIGFLEPDEVDAAIAHLNVAVLA
jgi:aryl-alcohol dehydrogenase-like predicted oxidoreductase